ncbi:MAG: phosphate ABC transporter permease PstA [Sphaerochaetaceae bacterium]
MINRNTANDIWIIVIKLLSFLTIFLLALILGYLIFKGLYSSKQTSRTVLNTIESNLDFEVYSSKNSSIKELDWFTLQKMGMGEIKNLRLLTKENVSFELYIEESQISKFASYLNLSEAQLRSHSIKLVNPQEITNYQKESGKILITKKGEKIPNLFKKVKVSDDVLVVNNSVIQTFDNKRITKLDEKQIEKLRNNEISNWSQLNGPDLNALYIPENQINEVGSIEGSYSFAKAISFEKAGNLGITNLETLKVVHIIKGINLTLKYIISPAEESGKFGGIITIIANTIFLVILTIIIAGPLGIGAAIFLVEYAKKGKWTQFIRTGIDLLAGVPSIIFGLFGLIAFVNFLDFSFSLISGSLTMSLMVLPTIIKTSEEALKSVDKELISGSRALGATKIETIWKVVLPSSSKGILSGIILSIGRTVGETAALIFTLGSSTDLAKNIFSSSRSLSMHIYLIITEGLAINDAFSSALLLIVLVLIINISTRKIMEKGQKKNERQ